MAEFRDFIDIAAPPETVFDYLTTNEGMTAWMGQYADLNPTPGGQFAVDITGQPVRGEYLVVEPYRRVVFTWGVTGTRLELRHFNLPETEVAGHKHGWTHFLPRLKTAGAGHDAGPDHWEPLPD